MNVDWRTVAAITIVAIGLSVAACGSSNNGKDNTSTADLYATQTAESSSTANTPTAAATLPAETPAQSFAEACVKSGEKTFASAPPRIIDTSKTYVATIKTDKGDIVVQLFSDTPVTTNNFVFLACKGVYDGQIFHRVVANFVIQGGDPGTGPGYKIPDERDSGHNMDTGSISFAKPSNQTTGQTLPDSAGSEFFVTIGRGSGGSLAYLDADFTVFGKVTSGQDIASQIQLGDKMNAVTIGEK